MPLSNTNALWRTERDFDSQGTLAEKSAQVAQVFRHFFTATGYGTPVADGKETREIKGRHYVLEESLTADFAFSARMESRYR